MAEKKVIIIGAGLAGLATGIYARMNGYQAEIFEHANQPGGVSAAYRRKDFLIDAGVHFYMGFRPGQPVNRLYRELGVVIGAVGELLGSVAVFVTLIYLAIQVRHASAEVNEAEILGRSLKRVRGSPHR